MTQTQPPPTPAPFGGPPPPLPTARPQRTNPLAIVALVLAFVVAPVAFVLGFVARSQIRRRGERGSGLAMTAIVLGAVFTVIGVVAIALAVTAMGRLSTDSLKAEVSRTVGTAVGVAPSVVNCPDSIARAAGTVSVCTATVDGTDITVTATQRDDQGNVNIEGTGWVSTAAVVKAIDDQVSASAGQSFATTCADGKKVVVGGPGATFSCTTAPTSDPSATQQVTVTVTSDAGDVTFAPAG